MYGAFHISTIKHTSIYNNMFEECVCEYNGLDAGNRDICYTNFAWLMWML